jgi:hypothetical protein
MNANNHPRECGAWPGGWLLLSCCRSLPAAAPAQSGGHLHSDLPLLTRVAEIRTLTPEQRR